MGFVVIATWTARPGEADYVAELITKLSPQNRAEPKNLAFQGQRSTDNPDVFVLYERYTDATGYDDHKATDAFQTHVVGDIIPRLESRTVATFTTLDEEA
jgi:quinol monooxygenase YgiN